MIEITGEFPTNLFHYTDVGGLQGILQSASLWSTHARYLNDSSEYTYGLNVIHKLLETHPDFNGYRSLLEQAGITSEDAAPLVSCLSEAGDTLSQWRGYGENGGYCIKFNSNVFIPSLRNVDRSGGALLGSIKVDQVSYGPGRLKADLTRIISAHREQREFSLRTGTSGGHSQVELLESVTHLAALLKDPGFREEREVRVSIHSRESFCTPSKIGLVPRGCVSFDPRSISAVIVGPGEHSASRETSVKRFLRARDLNHVDVTSSEIPYREVR